MQRQNKPSFFGLAFLLAASCTFAQTAVQAPVQGDLDATHFEQLDTNKDGRIAEAEYRQFMENAFDKLDTDRSGKLSPAETASILTSSQFATVDKDNNGQISREEFMQQVMEDFRRQDRNHDGHLQR